MKTDDFINIDEIVERHMNNMDKTSNINEQIWSEPIDDSFISLGNKNKVKDQTQQDNKIKTAPINFSDANLTKKIDLFDSRHKTLNFKLDDEVEKDKNKTNIIETKKTVNFSFNNLTSHLKENENKVNNDYQAQHCDIKKDDEPFLSSKTRTIMFDFNNPKSETNPKTQEKNSTWDFLNDFDNRTKNDNIETTNFDYKRTKTVKLKTKKLDDQDDEFSNLYNLNNHATRAFVQFENKYTNNFINDEIEQNDINNKKTNNLSKFFSNKPSVELTTEIDNNKYVSFNEPLENTQRKKGFFLLFSTKKKKKK